MDKIPEFFTVFSRPRSYTTIVYLLLSFPLGIFYFVYLITGISLGLGLSILGIGLLILLLMLVSWWGFIILELELANHLLGSAIPRLSQGVTAGLSPWEKFKKYISNPVTWKGLAFLFVKFPVGIFSFVMVVTLLSVSLAFVSAPFTYPLGEYDLYYFKIDTLHEALLLALLGIILLTASLHVFNFVGSAVKRLVMAMLS
jgi:hypothetical protein